LDRIRWKGEEYFRMLSCYFSVRWNFPQAQEMVRRTLWHLIVERDPDEHAFYAMPGLPPQYSIVKRRTPVGQFHVVVEDKLVATNRQLGFVIGQLLWHVNGQALRRSGDFLIIHAGAVCSPQVEGVLMPATTGSGKTTLTTGLVRAGFSYLSDEAGCIDPVSGMLYPYPRPLSFKLGNDLVFPDLYEGDNGWGKNWGERHISPTEMGPFPIGGPCPIRYVIAPKYVKGIRTELTPLSHVDGAMELLGNAFNLSLYGRRALPVVAGVVRRAKSYRLVSGDLEGAVRAITRLTSRRKRGASPAA